MKNIINSITINHDISIMTALKQMDEVNHKLLIVEKDGKYFSLLSIGDIQRAIIRNVSLSDPIYSILRENVNVSSIHDDENIVKEKMKERKTEYMPIIDDNSKVVNVIFWKDLFPTRRNQKGAKMSTPVVIMAGGQGQRLRPLTNVLPKPLIPIGDQTIIEDIIDNFSEYGCSVFYISINYKADIIKGYFTHIDNKCNSVKFFQEDKPLGTAGSLRLLKDDIHSTFFVSNCDILIDEDYSSILHFHRKNNNEITVVAALKTFSIPYGTLETSKGGKLRSIHEKPELMYKINTGMYILEPHLLDEIPPNKVFHITYLIEKLIKENRNVGVFPISEGSWTDIGNWEEYLKIIKA